MKYVNSILFFLMLVCCQVTTAQTGVLATKDDVARAMINAENPVFSGVVSQDYGLAAAVKFLLTANPAMGDSAKKAVEDALKVAHDNLSGAQGAFSDSSSMKLYEALVEYDLVSGSNLWDIAERESLRGSLKSLLDYYLRYDRYAWNDESWYLGTTAMRIVASSTLYALNFPDDTDFRHYLEHGIQFLEKNLENSIDDYGAWIPDSPGYLSFAVEYLIVTAKALRNAKVHDYFSHPRLQKVLQYEINLLPPQKSPHVRGVFMIAGEGQTDTGNNHGATAVLAAADIKPYSPSTASNLLWYWKQCGEPVDPFVLLFIDTSIPESPPDGKSMIAGCGMTVLRYDFDTPEESDLFAGFGSADGIPGRESRGHSGSGDYSFVWRGIPLIVQDGSFGYGCSERFMNDAAWRHNLVTKRDLGSTPVIQDAVNSPELAHESTFKGTKNPADFYPEGINQFLSTAMMDYVSGKVRMSPRDIPPLSYYRHFLYLKPDALLIWDQIDSTYPLEWNLWIPVETIGTENNRLHLLTQYDVDLEVYFPGETTIDYIAMKPEEERTWDWPLIMRSESGTGAVYLSFIDLVACTLEEGPSCGLDILRNILSQGRPPELVGITGDPKETVDVLTRIKIPCEILSYKDLMETNLSAYSTILIGSHTSAGIDRALIESGSKIDRFVKEGGSVLWMCPTPLNWRGKNSDGPEFVPSVLVPGTCPVRLDGIDYDPRTDLKLYSDAVWQKPGEITSQAFISWITKSGSGDNRPVSSWRIVYPPIEWSESWKVLASLRKTFTDQLYAKEKPGEPTRIRVRHPASKDFFTFLLPHQLKISQVEIKKQNSGHVIIADPTTTWEIQAGETSWTDANLSVRISTIDGIKDICAFDCTFVNTGDTKFSSQKPMSIYYSPLEGAGVIMCASNTIVSTPRLVFKLYAGEVNFYDFRGDVWTDRISFISRISALDNSGSPVPGVKIYLAGRITGVTGEDGTLTVRWHDKVPVAVAKHGDYETPVQLVPGNTFVRIPGE